jgi:hypothetical protein
MLSGLRSAASVLTTGREIRHPKRSDNILKDKSYPFIHNSPGYYKDNYNIIRTPSGKPLFTASEKYEVGLDGTIFEHDKPVGVIRMFDVASSVITAEDAISLFTSAGLNPRPRFMAGYLYYSNIIKAETLRSNSGSANL